MWLFHHSSQFSAFLSNFCQICRFYWDIDIQYQYQAFMVNCSSSIFTSVLLHCVSMFGTCRTFPWDKHLLFYLCINIYVLAYVWKTHCSGFMPPQNKSNNICTDIYPTKTFALQLSASELCWIFGCLERQVLSEFIVQTSSF